MGTIFSIIMYGILWLIVLFLFFSVITNIAIVNNILKVIIEKIKKSYEYIRQHVRKESDEVYDDTGTVYNGPEFYDSSSEWQD